MLTAADNARMIETIISRVQINMMFLMLSLMALIQPQINV